jgi:hypothetical protein
LTLTAFFNAAQTYQSLQRRFVCGGCVAKLKRLLILHLGSPSGPPPLSDNQVC